MVHSTAKQIAEKYATAIWNEKNLSMVDQLIAEKAVIHSLLGEFYGPDRMKEIVLTWLNGFPDLHVDHDLILQDGDLVTIQWRAKGTHLGEFKGRKATGKPVSYSGVTLYRIQKEQIVEYWAYLDMHHLFNQL